MKQSKIIFLILYVISFSCNEQSRLDSKNTYIDLKKLDIEKQTKESSDSVHKFTVVYFKKPKTIEVSTQLKKCIKETIESVETIDFTGDKLLDFICKSKTDTFGIGFEYWISSDYKVIKKLSYISDFLVYRWFINLDEDPEPEIYEATVEEDGADYIIYDQDIKTRKNIKLLYINPIIIENNKNYWGYPWDILNIKARTNGQKTELYCSLNHQIIRDGNEVIDPKNQKQIPIIFFGGHHTQESEQNNIKDEQWMTLSEIINQIKR